MKIKKPMMFYIVSFVVIAIWAMISINLTSLSEATVHDSSAYLNEASNIFHSNNLVKAFLFPTSIKFSDTGYAFVISLLMKIGGENNILLFQIFNFIFWWVSCILIYHSLLLISSKKKAFGVGVLMALSPTFLTFSAKIYSEPLAALGVSIIIYSLIDKTKYKSAILLLLGTIILLTTKSVFLLLAIGLLIFTVVKRKWLKMFALLLSLILIFPILKSSMSGGRSRLNLAIQTGKLNMSYMENLACIPYHLSFPLGKAVLPDHQNTCIIFSSDPGLPRYEKNPTNIGNQKYYSKNSFTYTDALNEIISQPLKYTLVIFIDTLNLVFIEGFYGTVLLDTSLPIRIFLYTYGKLISLWLWYRAGLVVLRFSKKKLWKTALLFSPVLYFIFIVSHFHIEPRYFYPFLPWLYFVGSLKKASLKTLKINNAPVGVK